MVSNKASQSYIKIRVSKIGVTRLLTGAVVLLHLANVPAVIFRYLFDDFWMGGTCVSIFRVSSEGKIPTWYSSCALLFCSVLLAIIAFSKKNHRDPYLLHWLGLSIVFLFISLDEATAMHEVTSDPLRSFLDTKGIFYFA